MINQNKHKLFAFLSIFLAPALSLSVSSGASAQATSTIKGFDKLCTSYKEIGERNACGDGLKGADCSDYLQLYDQAHVDICQKAAREAPTVDTPVTPPTTSSQGNTNASNNGFNDTLQQLIDQSRNAQEITQKADKPDKIDNVKANYLNGADKKQALKVLNPGTGKSPVIVFINGGGWHFNDGVGEKISPKAAERGYATIEATYRLGSSGIYYMYEDVMRAIKHVRDNAGAFGIDPTRIVIWGDSAGGSLAMRVAASGQSGVAAAVGWSAPTNGYTAIFRSYKSFLIGMDHSTCVPTDLNGFANVVDLLNGGNGDNPDTGDLTNNGINSQNGIINGGNDVVNIVSQVLTLNQQSQKTSTTVQTLQSLIEKNAQNGGGNPNTGNSGIDSAISAANGIANGIGGDQNVRRLGTKKILQCSDNFRDMSPALFASPLSPPTFLAGFSNDSLVGPDQLYQMRDKLRTLGVPSSAMVLPGVPGETKAGENHLDYNEKFVKPSLDFVDKFVHPPNAPKK